jgi:hypothetical protein
MSNIKRRAANPDSDFEMRDIQYAARISGGKYTF